MADQLTLTYWLRGFSEHNMLRHFERMLRQFPYSRLSPGATLRVRAVDLSEPVLFERRFTEIENTAEIIASAAEFRNPDVCFEIEAAWDLLQFEGEWKLKPSAALLSCFGPQFETEAGEHLRLDFGIDAHFLPQPEFPDSLVMVQSNIKSLLHLVHTLDDTLKVERRQLSSESGENFAERLQSALS